MSRRDPLARLRPRLVRRDRRCWLVGLLIAAAACTPTLTTRETPTAGTGDSALPAATTSRPACAPATSGWTQVNDLRGFLAHDGVALAGCRLVIGADQVSTGTMLLMSDDAGRSLRPVPVSGLVKLHQLAASADGARVWVVGEDANGHASITGSSDAGRSWASLAPPASLRSADAIALAGERVLISGRNEQGAVLLSAQPGGSWTEIFQLPSRPGGNPQLNRIVVSGSSALAVGTDGATGVALISRDSTASWKRVEDPVFLHSATAAAFISQDEIVVGGYQGPRPENGVGMFGRLSLTTGHWEALKVPDSVQVEDLAVFGDRVYVALATGHGDAIESLPSAGQAWVVEIASTPTAPLVLQRVVFSPDGRGFALGPASPLLTTVR